MKSITKPRKIFPISEVKQSLKGAKTIATGILEQPLDFLNRAMESMYRFFIKTKGIFKRNALIISFIILIILTILLSSFM